MLTNIVVPERTQITIYYGACALHPGYQKLKTHTICNTHCFSTITMGSLTRLKVRLYVHCLSLIDINWHIRELG